MKTYPMMEMKLKSALKGAIERLLDDDYRFMGGRKIQQMLSEDLVQLFTEHTRGLDQLEVGQLLWYAVDVNEKHSYRKTSENTRLRPIVLTLITAEEIQRRQNGYTLTQIRDARIARLYQEAYDQGAVLTLDDISFLLNCCNPTVVKATQRFQATHGKPLPTRGVIHDIGRGITHKKQIVKYFLQGIQTPDIARKTNHSESACDRYIKGYRRVTRLYQDQKSTEFIAEVLSMSRLLVGEYVDLYRMMEMGQ